MNQQRQYDLRDLRDETAVFWSGGNHPTQKIYGLSTSVVLEHLKALYLLCDKVLAAGSFFFESGITREVTDRLELLFEQGDVLYFVDDDIKNFDEHGRKKMEKSPIDLACYRDTNFVKRCGERLDSLRFILRRPSRSISDRIVDLWIDDIYSKEPETIGYYLWGRIKKEDERLFLIDSLIRIAKYRKKDFVWEYLGPRLMQLNLPKEFLLLVRRRLAEMYSMATSELLGVPLDRHRFLSQKSRITGYSRFDTSLFLSCMSALKVTEHFRCLEPLDLVFLKRSDEFNYFKIFYFQLIETVGYIPAELRIILPPYRDAAMHFAKSNVTAAQFLDNFSYFCKSIGKPEDRYLKPLDVLLRTYSMTSRLPIEDFLEKLIRVTRSVPSDPLSMAISDRITEHPTKLIVSLEVPMIKILFLSANPLDTSPLRIDEEIRTIDEKIRQAKYRDIFDDIRQHLAVRITDLQGYLLRHTPHILHFSGHGSPSSEIVLEDITGKSQVVPTEALEKLFSVLKDNVRLVVLNACYSENQARSIARHIACVVGDLGCSQINLEGIPEENTPKLLVRDGTNPRDVVFVSFGEPSSEVVNK